MVLDEIRDGTFAREWIAEMDAGEGKLEELRRRAADQLLEQVGRELRALMQTEAPETHGVR
jgi:ketol-acid reductoisomerase